MNSCSRLLLVTLFWAFSSLAAAEKPDTPTTAWVGLGVGAGAGHVEYDCTTGFQAPRCREAGIAQWVSGSLTASNEFAFRARWTHSLEDTDTPPKELAIMLGVPTGGPRAPIIFVGMSRIFDADDQIKKILNGVALEVLFARWGGEQVGGEFSMHGAYSNDDFRYLGVNLGIRFGDLR